jgi:hypothetical protein
MLLQGFLFLLGAFGTKWTMRGARSTRLDIDHALGIVQLFLPVSFLGMALWFLFLEGMTAGGFGEVLLRVHVMLLVASPLLAVILSCPLPEATRGQLARVRAAIGRPTAQSARS